MKEILGLTASFNVAVGLAWILFVPYLISLGYTALDVVLFYTVLFASSMLAMALTRNWKTKNYMTFGLTMRACTLAAAIFVSHSFHLFLIAIMFSFVLSDYWVVFNSLAEHHTKKTNRAFRNSMIMGVGPAVNIVVPLIAGLVAESHGFFWLFAVGSILMVIPIYLTRSTGEKRIKMNLLQSDSDNSRVREAVFLEGITAGTVWVIPLVITLEFVSGTFEFGAFFSYLALAGAVSALAIGRRSDHEGKRNKYIIPVMRLRGAAIILAGLANSFLMWFVAMGATRYLGSIKWPFTWTLVTESADNIEEAMLAREFWLNVGRLFSMFTTVACLMLFGSVQYGLVVGGLASIAFPTVMKFRKL